ncbi:hypothetical protein [Streptomyces sp. NPDC048340]|uniref:hypothetical protein n=1 Tax=Streptomyces sp. NPDC048340 TaxID=3365537 RepID=UPI00371DEC08
MDLATGEMVGGPDSQSRGARGPDPQSGDTRFHFDGGGRWASYGKKLVARIWAKGSGYTKNDKLIVGFYLGQTQVGLKPVPLTKQEIARELEMRPASAGESMNRLARGNILIPVQQFGAIVLYRLNVRLVYDGGSEQQREQAKCDPAAIIPLTD